MTQPAPRPCLHTGFAIVCVLIAGLALGAFSPQPKADAPAASAPIAALR